jgi:hypothetical protein
MSKRADSGVYLLHFAERISPKHTTQHYLGYGDSLARRTAEQLSGGSAAARLPQVAAERGIAAVVARTWPGATRADERRLKNRKDAPSLCPVCRAAKKGEQG